MASGRYQNASEVFREGLRLLERQETEDSARVAALLAAADTDWADLAVGRFIDIDDDELDVVIGRLGARSATPREVRGLMAVFGLTSSPLLSVLTPVIAPSEWLSHRLEK